jgi:hypothetical protein
MSVVTSTPVYLVTWSNTWIFFIAAILGLSLSLCFILTICTCRSFFLNYTCETLDEDFESETYNWQPTEEKSVAEFQPQFANQNQSIESLNGKGRKVVGLKAVVVDC